MGVATGLASVATSIAGSTDVLLEHRRTGWLVPADNASALTTALQTLIGDDEERRRCGRLARELIVSKYAIHATAPLWLAEYRALSRHA